jgi:sugar phosphate isomerase/epimerase
MGVLPDHEMSHMEKFKLCILFGDSPDLDPAQIAPGWEMAEIPVGLVVRPFDSETTWEARCATIQSWHLPPIKVASHFIHDWGLTPIGPTADWDQLNFWSERALRRLGDLGVEAAGVYGNFFTIPEGVSPTRGQDDAIRWVNILADYAEKYNVKIALEPTAEPQTLFPMYLDAIEFARKEIGRDVVRVMADLNYFIKGNQPLEHIARDPAYCLHVHIAGENGQPGVGDRVGIHTQLFRVLRDIHYTGGVSTACPWVSTSGAKKVDFRAETSKSLVYLRNLREQVYAE